MKIAIIGGGIIGYSCALQILEHYNALKVSTEITIISDDFTPNTTGDGSAGLWGPYLLNGTSQAKILEWSSSMHHFLEKIWLSEDAGVAGVCLIPVVRLTTSEKPVETFWNDIVYGFVPLTQKQLSEFNEGKQKKYLSGYHFLTYTSEPIKLLPYIMKRFEASGGKTIQQKVDNFEAFVEKSAYDVIVNCTGLGAKKLLTDKNMFPVRGQVSRVKANWIYNVFLDESDDGNYIIPNVDSVVLGGTHQKNDYNLAVSKDDKEIIVNGCRQILPSLKYAQHLCDWVGLRPGREEVHLQASNQGNKIVIHNYGHGGSGVTLAWGTAENVLQLLQNEISKMRPNQSKL